MPTLTRQIGPKSRIVLRLDTALEPDRARRSFESHLARAKWLAGQGYRDLLRGG